MANQAVDVNAYELLGVKFEPQKPKSDSLQTTISQSHQTEYGYIIIFVFKTYELLLYQSTQQSRCSAMRLFIAFKQT